MSVSIWIVCVMGQKTVFNIAKAGTLSCHSDVLVRSYLCILEDSNTAYTGPRYRAAYVSRKIDLTLSQGPFLVVCLQCRHCSSLLVYAVTLMQTNLKKLP